jgi:hypothetical protein
MAKLWLAQITSDPHDPDKDDMTHWTRAPDFDSACAAVRAELWGAIEPGDFIRISGPYAELAWSDWEKC